MIERKLKADEIRELEEGDYIVAKLHDDEYWEQGEGRVQYVKEWDNGNIHVVFDGGRLKVPADARQGIRLSGEARGASNLRVKSVHRK